MKKCWIVLFLVVCQVSICRPQMPCTIENKTFVAGEKLTYQLYFNLGFVWIQAGACDFKARSTTWNNQPAYQLMIQGKTQKSFDSFYKVRDTLVSYVDKETLVPFKAYKFTHEDTWNGIDDFTFKKEDNGWRITTRLQRKKKWKDPVESWTSQCGFDIVTNIYKIRCLSDDDLFTKGRRMEIPVRLDDNEYKIYLTYLGKERIKLYGGGYYNAHAYSLTLIEGTLFKRSDMLKMWLSDDGNRIPLLIESPIKLGNVKAVFRDAQNTLYPLSQASLVK